MNYFYLIIMCFITHSSHCMNDYFDSDNNNSISNEIIGENIVEPSPNIGFNKEALKELEMKKEIENLKEQLKYYEEQYAKTSWNPLSETKRKEFLLQSIYILKNKIISLEEELKNLEEQRFF